jgi:hypothetical protein
LPDPGPAAYEGSERHRMAGSLTRSRFSSHHFSFTAVVTSLTGRTVSQS